MLYFKGRHYEDAVKWFEKAANQGHVAAQVELAKMYYYGDGVDENDENAFKWYQEAAKRNHPEALYFLGDMYEYGHGVNKNLEEAIKWYTLAAEQGNVDAQRELSGIYLYAKEPDLLKAYEVLSDPSLDKQKLAVGMILVSNGVTVDMDFIKTFELMMIGNNDFRNAHDGKISIYKIYMKAYEQNKDELISFMIENHDLW